jgi:hypothetical protein
MRGSSGSCSVAAVVPVAAVVFTIGLFTTSSAAAGVATASPAATADAADDADDDAGDRPGGGRGAAPTDDTARSGRGGTSDRRGADRDRGDADVADADPDAPPIRRRAVSLLPLAGGGRVTSKQARGLTAQVRAALTTLVDEGALRLLPATSDDAAALRRCVEVVDCYATVARTRGADRLALGRVAPGDGGLAVTLTVAPDGRVVTTTLDGGAGDAARLDRLVREAFAEDTLRGSVRVVGQPGDIVEVDGRRVAALTADGFVEVPRLREGKHALRVTRPESKNGTAYDPYAHDVVVRHAEQTTVKVVLLPRESTGALGAEVASVPQGPPVAAIVSTATGGVLLAGAVTFGVLSLLDSREVEKRAADQQLVFPRDEELVTRGTTLAIVADILYGAGALALGGGVALWMTSSSPATEEAP